MQRNSSTVVYDDALLNLRMGSSDAAFSYKAKLRLTAKLEAIGKELQSLTWMVPSQQVETPKSRLTAALFACQKPEEVDNIPEQILTDALAIKYDQLPSAVFDHVHVILGEMCSVHDTYADLAKTFLQKRADKRRREQAAAFAATALTPDELRSLKARIEALRAQAEQESAPAAPAAPAAPKLLSRKRRS